MNTNPINLTVRFLLEIAMLIALGYWGWYSIYIMLYDGTWVILRNKPNEGFIGRVENKGKRQ